MIYMAKFFLKYSYISVSTPGGYVDDLTQVKVPLMPCLSKIAIFGGPRFQPVPEQGTPIRSNI